MSDRKLNSLFRRFQRRHDVRALAQVFDLAAPELLRVARFLTPDESAAEDAVQATFLTAIEKRDQYTANARLMPWLLGILTRKARQSNTRSRREPDAERLEESHERRAPMDPADLAAARELESLVEETLNRLPPKYAAALGPYLRYGKSPGEIARTLGISANATSVRIHRGLDQLRRALPKGAAIGSAAASAQAAQATSLSRVRSAVLEHGRSLAAEVAKSSGLVAGAASPAAGITALGGLTMGKLAFIATAVALAAGATFAWTRHRHTSELERLQSEIERLETALANAREGQGAKLTDSHRSGALPEGGRSVPTPVEAVQPAAAARDEVEIPASPQLWLSRFEQAADWREALAIAQELAKLDPDASLAVLQEIFHDIPDANHRRQVLKPFCFDGGLANALDVLDLAATDPSLEVRDAGFLFLKDYAFQDFTGDPQAYAAWHATYSGRPLEDVLRENLAALNRRLSTASAEELLQQFKSVRRIDLRTGKNEGIDLRNLLLEAGIEQAVARRVRVDEDPTVAAEALRWLHNLEAREATLREVALPIVQNAALYDPKLQSAAYHALGRPGFDWAVDPIVKQMANIPIAADSLSLASPASALAEIGDPSVIPTLIGMIVADDGYATCYGVGYFGLSKLTGIDYDESHDAAFWVDWWERNRGTLPPEIGSLEIPTVSLTR